MLKTRSLLFHLIFYSSLAISLSSLGTIIALDHFLAQHEDERIDDELVSRLMILTMELDQLPVEDQAGHTALLNHSGLVHGIEKAVFQILDAAGQPIATSEDRFWNDLAQSTLPAKTENAYQVVFADLDSTEKTARLLYYRISDSKILRIGMDTRDDLKVRANTRSLILIGFAISLASSIFFISVITFRAISGLRGVSRLANEIRERADLDERVPGETGFLETDELAHTFNRMMDRIHLLVGNLKTVLDHFAHDLKTPITRLRGLGERAARKQAGDPISGMVVEECDRIIDMLDLVLGITGVQVGLYQWRKSNFDFAATVAEGIALFQPAFEASDLEIRAHLPSRLMVHSDEQVLQRVVANLLENAIKYTNEGTVDVSLTEHEDHIELAVSDTGIGVPEQERDSIFEPFYRAERAGEGYGLGLSFCRAALEAMGGAITCKSGAHGQGSCFTVTLTRMVIQVHNPDGSENRGPQ